MQKQTRDSQSSRPNGGSVVGVHITTGSLRLAQSRRGKIQAYRRVDLPRHMELSSPEFEGFLGDTLRAFCGKGNHVSIWVTAPLERHSVRNLRVPNVPRRQLLHAVRWALRRELSSALKHTVLDYIVEGDVVENGAPKIAVTACAVHEGDVARLSALFAKVGFPLSGLTVPFFTCRNVVRACEFLNNNQSALVLDVGLNSSQIFLYSEGKTVVNREFRLGVNAFLDTSLGIDLADDGASKERFFARLGHDEEGDAPLVHPDRKAIVESFRPVLNRLMRQFDLTLQSSAVNISDLGLTQIYLAGPLCLCREIGELIGEHLGLSVVPIHPLAPPCLSPGCTPAPLSQGAWFVPAVGLALADNAHTLNLLRPAQSTVEREEHLNLNHRILVAFIGCMLAAGAVWGTVDIRASQLLRKAESLERRLRNAAPVQSMPSLESSVSALMDKYRRRSEIVNERIVLAMMRDLVESTDPQVQLIDVVFLMGSVEHKSERESKSSANRAGNRIRIKGRIAGGSTQGASILAAYQLKLAESPRFGHVNIEESVMAVHAGAEVLQFSILLDPVALEQNTGGVQ